MSLTRLQLWLLVSLLLAGCQLFAPGVSQLGDMKSNDDKGNLQGNASAVVACSASDPECYQLHLLKGDACYALSRQTQGAARRANEDCAAKELDAGAAQAPDEQTPVGTIRDYTVKRLEALHDLIDMRRAGDPSGADELAASAQAFRQRYRGDAAGLYYLASARLTSAQDQFTATQNKAPPCAALPPINALAGDGARSTGSFTVNFAEMTTSHAGMRRAGSCL
jgi:hypothetical protein